MSAFENGQPCWMDVSVPDAAARQELTTFLGTLFGWTFEVGGPETGYYTMAFSDGGPVAAINTSDEGVGQWILYLATDDIAATAAAITQAGGQVFMGPMQVMDFGSMALALDPTGAAFGVWQPDQFTGFGAFGRFDAPCWFDLQTPDPNAAAAFYSAVFGLTSDDRFGPQTRILSRGDAIHASISPSPGDMPPYWNVIVATSSLQESESRAAAAGGTILMSGMTVPGGTASAFASPGIGAIVTVFDSPEMPGR